MGIIEILTEERFFKKVVKKWETIANEKPLKEQLEFVKFEKKLDDVEQSQPRILISNTTFKKVKILHSVYRSDDGDKLVIIVRLVKYNMVNGMLSKGDIINIKFKKDDITADFEDFRNTWSF